MPASAQEVSRLSDDAEISVITVLPGDAVYSAFGHSALRVRDSSSDIDWLFNYGTFEFRDPLFLPKFIMGKLDYALSVTNFSASLAFYRDVENRPVIEQALLLTPEQRQELFDFLVWNAEPANRYYRYDFFYDNCSTRILDAIERAIDSPLAIDQSNSTSFRRLLDPYLARRPFLDFGIDLLLGRPADAVPSTRQLSFLPNNLMNLLESASVEDAAMVAEPEILFWTDLAQARSIPSIQWPLMMAWAILAALVVVDVLPGRHVPRVVDALLFAVVGLAGLLIAFMWLVTEHAVTRNNLNLLWALPTHLPIAYMLLRDRGGPVVRAYLLATALLGLVVLVGLRWFPQELPLAAIPIVIALTVRSLRTGLERGRRARLARSTGS